MAALTNADRIAIWQKMMEAMSRANESCSLTKPQLRAAIDAADDWADTNAAAYNNALPAAARTNLTAKQKAYLLALVIMRRWEVG